MEVDTYFGTTDTQPDCDKAEGLFTLCPMHMGEYLQVLPCQPSGNPATQLAWKINLQQGNIAVGYTFPCSVQRCLMLGATVSPLHRASKPTPVLGGLLSSTPLEGNILTQREKSWNSSQEGRICPSLLCPG